MRFSSLGKSGGSIASDFEPAGMLYFSMNVFQNSFDETFITNLPFPKPDEMKYFDGFFPEYFFISGMATVFRNSVFVLITLTEYPLFDICPSLAIIPASTSRS